MSDISYTDKIVIIDFGSQTLNLLPAELES